MMMTLNESPSEKEGKWKQRWDPTPILGGPQ